MCGKTPPALSSNFMYIDTNYRYPKDLKIFVPDNVLEDYKQKWMDVRNDKNRIIDNIKPFSEYQG